MASAYYLTLNDAVADRLGYIWYPLSIELPASCSCSACGNLIPLGFPICVPLEHLSLELRLHVGCWERSFGVGVFRFESVPALARKEV